MQWPLPSLQPLAFNKGSVAQAFLARGYGCCGQGQGQPAAC
ncbi:Uncharacterized protein PPKH_3401 [Pseudomonas putida]|nr:Uncharacterized protein PPKH_3401 [Pseudomonas putida]